MVANVNISWYYHLPIELLPTEVGLLLALSSWGWGLSGWRLRYFGSVSKVSYCTNFPLLSNTNSELSDFVTCQRKKQVLYQWPMVYTSTDSALFLSSLPRSHTEQVAEGAVERYRPRTDAHLLSPPQRTGVVGHVPQDISHAVLINISRDMFGHGIILCLILNLIKTHWNENCQILMHDNLTLKTAKPHSKDIVQFFIAKLN